MDKTKAFEAAGKFASKGQLDKAAKEYQRILDEDPKDVRALQKLAEIHQKAGKTKESTDLMLRVAEGYTEQGFFLKAVAVYKQILKVGPERIEVNHRLAQLYQQLGLIGDATQQYQTVANHYDKLGNVKESLAALRRMVDLDPDNVASQVKLGELYAREQMTAEAIVELRKASQFLKRNNRPDDFVRVLERIGQLAPDDAVVARELAQSFLAHGDTKRALARLQVCFRADPKDVETLQLLARAFTDLGQDAKTVSVYRELAKVHAERGAADAERDILQRILELSPTDEESVARLRAMAAAHAPPAVIAMAPPPGPVRAGAPPAPAPAPARPAPAARPPRPPTPGLSASITKILTEVDVYLKYGLVPKAADHVRKALAEDPRCLDAHEKLLAVLDRQGKAAEALAELATMVELARAARDADRDGAYTQDLAQRSPDHPLVRSAAAAADLPEADDDEVIIEPEDGHSIPPGDEEESIEIDTETTAPPVRAPALRSRPPVAAAISASRLPADSRRASRSERESFQPAAQQNPFVPPRERSAPPPAGSLGPRNPFVRGAEPSLAPGRAPWDPPGPGQEEEVVVEPDSMEPYEPKTIPGELREKREPLSIAPVDPFANEDEAPFAAQPPNPFVAREPTRAPPPARPTRPPPPPSAEEERTGGFTGPFRKADSTGRVTGPVDRGQPGATPSDASGPWSRGRLNEGPGAAPPLAPPPAAFPPPPANFPPPEAQAEELPTVDATLLDDGEAPPPGDLETTSELAALSEAAAPAEPGEAPAVDPFAEELAEAEFLVQQDLADDARRALEAILEQSPGHAAATALLESLPLEPRAEPADRAPASSQARPPAATGEEQPPEDAGGGDSSGGFDLGRELAGEFEDDAEADVKEAVPQHSVRDMLAEFKKKLSVTVSAEDSQTHYDLGIAYKEMGLYDEATHEFEVALQGRGRRRVVDCLIMLGVCRLEKGLPREALPHFEQALKTPGLTLEASKEAHFQLGVCLELIEEDRAALDHYGRVYKADQGYRDVKVRVARLTQKIRASGGPTPNGTPLKNGVVRQVDEEGTPGPQADEPKPPPVSGIGRAVRGKIGYI